jgi:hypothetical protein
MIAESSIVHAAASWDEAPQRFSDRLIASDVPEQQTVGLDISWPYYPSVLYPSVFLERVNVRGYYQTGIRLRDTWNARVTDCFINAPIISDEENANPSIMEAGIDLIGAMDCHILQPCITGAKSGIRARSAPDGHPRSEGLRIRDGWMMHCNVGIDIQGTNYGGWPTPVVAIHGGHIAFNSHAIFIVGVSHLDIDGVNCYASAYHRGRWAIFLVGCKSVQIRGCGFWTNWDPPGFFGGIVLDACEDVTITDGTFVESIGLALHATPRCKGVRTNGAIWTELQRQGKVANYAR